MRNVFAHATNYSYNTRYDSSIKYIVIHYTGNINDTAINNCKYYQTPNLKVSAHYFVDDKEVICSVPPNHAAYAVGGNKYASCKTTGGGTLYKVCTNSNSISIEICGGKKTYYPPQETIDRAVELTKQLMAKYNIEIDHVIRHFDVTGKICPAWAINLDTHIQGNARQEWSDFLLAITKECTTVTEAEYQKFKQCMDRYLQERSETEQPSFDKAIQLGQQLKIMTDGRPYSFTTRGETLTMILRAIGRM